MGTKLQIDCVWFKFFMIRKFAVILGWVEKILIVSFRTKGFWIGTKSKDKNFRAFG